MRILLSFGLLAVLLGSNSVFSQDLDGNKVVSAPTSEGAQEAARQELTDEGGGACFISTGSGIGVVAVGVGDYDHAGEETTPRDMQLIAQRQAFIKATIEARVKLAKFLHGLSITAQNEIVMQTDMVRSDDGTVMNSKSVTTEDISDCMNGFLRGAVVMEVYDDIDNFRVYVTIVTTPKTQGAIQTASGGNVTAHTLAEGKEEIISQIEKGVVPPIGGRIVTTLSGETAWIGFGSAIISRVDDGPGSRMVNKSFKTQAEKDSEREANASLLAIISGETVSSSSNLYSSFTEEIKMFDRVEGVNGESEIQKLEVRQISILHEQIMASNARTTASGQLPAGVSPVTNSNADWAYSYAIFIPDSTITAEDIATSMQKSSPLDSLDKLRELRKNSASYERNPDGSFKKDKDGKYVLKPLPSGTVTPLEDL